MTLTLLKILVGLITLVWGADKVVTYALSLAKKLNVAPMLVGLTIVALGTTFPEIIISIIASLRGNSGLAIGNAIGSNIANIGLVIGLCALSAPLVLTKNNIKKEITILIMVTLLACVLLTYLAYNQITGIILGAGGLWFVYWLVQQSKKKDAYGINPDEVSDLESAHCGDSYPLITFWILAGLGLLIGGAHFLIQGCVELAQTFGINDTIIGLTVVAIGTSLPELASSIAATMKKEPEVAIGNVIGSNIFNLTAVLAPPAIISPKTDIDSRVFVMDIPVMIGLTLFISALVLYKKKTISRFSGGLLLVGYFSYIGYIGYQSFA